MNIQRGKQPQLFLKISTDQEQTEVTIDGVKRIYGQECPFGALKAGKHVINFKICESEFEREFEFESDKNYIVELKKDGTIEFQIGNFHKDREIYPASENFVSNRTNHICIMCAGFMVSVNE